MSRLHKSCVRMLVVAMIAALVVGCGDEDLHGDNAGENQDQQNQDNQQENDDEGCADDEQWNPVLEECVEASGNNDDEECAEDEYFEDGECQAKCPADEFWDTEEEECVDIDGDCGEFEEWDEDLEECVHTGECGPGSIIGQTCRPDEAVLPGAQVTLEGQDCDGYEFEMETQADNNGDYSFEDVPAGIHSLTISSGSWEDTDDVIVQKGTETDLTTEAAKICVEGDSVNIAVFEGSFDDIGSILDGMDIDYSSYSGSTEIGNLVNDMSALEEYDIVFAQCGTASLTTLPDSDVAESNLRQFVNTGNSLYASDLRSEYIGNTLEDAATFSGSGSSQTVDVDVVTPEMQDLVGPTTEIVFNLGGWHVIESAGPATTVHFEVDRDIINVSHPDQMVPLMFVYHDPIGDGRAIYTSFHNNQQATGDMQDILEHMIFQL